jgi:cobalt-zinc-cadmium efflux system outer membrane protein
MRSTAVLTAYTHAKRVSLLACALALAAPQPSWAGEVFSLSQLEALARAANPTLKAGAAQIDGAQAQVSTARAFPNPEVEYLTGSSRYRPGLNGVSGASESLGVTQALDLPFRRTPRIAAARAGLAATRSAYAAFELDWIADLRRAYFDALRRSAETQNAKEDLALMQAVHDKISLRVKQGDAPRIELIRVEADLLSVQKFAQAAVLREEQARLHLRELVGPQLPADFALTGQLDAQLPLPPFNQLVEGALSRNPSLERAKAQADQARYRLNYEEAGRLPTVSLRATHDADREIRQTRIGLSLSIPLWDRKTGPVKEAEAKVAETGLLRDAEAFAIRQRLDIAWRQHDVAKGQVNALENGLLARAKSAVSVAETAYKSGERGLMDVLDAQRVYRAARADLITSRFELAEAWIEIQRLAATPETPAFTRNMP